MQQFSQLLHPSKDKTRQIKLKNGYPEWGVLSGISNEYLIEMKLKALREKDVLDVSKLKELRNLK